MNSDELQKTLRNVQNADLVWAEVCGGKLDGKFIPLWISPEIAVQFSQPNAGLIEAKAYMVSLNDAAAAGILREKIANVRGPSAKWPKRLEMQRGPGGMYIANRRSKNVDNF